MLLKFLKLRFFLVPYAVIILLLISFILIYKKEELHLILTRHRSLASDYFFMAWTEVGGTLPYIFIGILFFYRYSLALYLTTAQLLGGVFSVILKRIFDAPRPRLYFEQLSPHVSLPHIEGWDLYRHHSMPSGHTITAFALFFGLALISKKKYVHVLCLVGAVLVAYSRVYLSQHFAADVLAGSAIGIFCAWVCVPLYYKWEAKYDGASLRDSFRRK